MRLALAVLLASVCVSLFFVVRLQPTSAGAFAFLAVRHLEGLPLSYPGTTGVPHPCRGGVLALA